MSTMSSPSSSTSTNGSGLPSLRYSENMRRLVAIVVSRPSAAGGVRVRGLGLGAAGGAAGVLSAACRFRLRLGLRGVATAHHQVVPLFLAGREEFPAIRADQCHWLHQRTLTNRVS